MSSWVNRPPVQPGLRTIDVLPGQVMWFGDNRPAEEGSLCPHVCPHESFEVVAWGPNALFYSLLECQQCLCRGWEGVLGGAAQLYSSVT